MPYKGVNFYITTSLYAYNLKKQNHTIPNLLGSTNYESNNVVYKLKTI